MDDFLQSIAAEWPDLKGFLTVLFRLTLAAAVGALSRVAARTPAHPRRAADAHDRGAGFGDLHHGRADTGATMESTTAA